MRVFRIRPDGTSLHSNAAEITMRKREKRLFMLKTD